MLTNSSVFAHANLRMASDVCMFYSGVRDIEPRPATHAARRVFFLRGESVSREEQGAVAVHAADLPCVRAHLARSDIRSQQCALARAPSPARVCRRLL